MQHNKQWQIQKKKKKKSWGVNEEIECAECKIFVRKHVAFSQTVSGL